MELLNCMRMIPNSVVQLGTILHSIRPHKTTVQLPVQIELIFDYFYCCKVIYYIIVPVTLVI